MCDNPIEKSHSDRPSLSHILLRRSGAGGYIFFSQGKKGKEGPYVLQLTAHRPTIILVLYLLCEYTTTVPPLPLLLLLSSLSPISQRRRRAEKRGEDMKGTDEVSPIISENYSFFL